MNKAACQTKFSRCALAPQWHLTGCDCNGIQAEQHGVPCYITKRNGAPASGMYAVPGCQIAACAAKGAEVTFGRALRHAGRCWHGCAGKTVPKPRPVAPGNYIAAFGGMGSFSSGVQSLRAACQLQQECTGETNGYFPAYCCAWDLGLEIVNKLQSMSAAAKVTCAVTGKASADHCDEWSRAAAWPVAGLALRRWHTAEYCDRALLLTDSSGAIILPTAEVNVYGSRTLAVVAALVAGRPEYFQVTALVRHLSADDLMTAYLALPSCVDGSASGENWVHLNSSPAGKPTVPPPSAAPTPPQARDSTPGSGRGAWTEVCCEEQRVGNN